MAKFKDPYSFVLEPQEPYKPIICGFTYSDGRKCTMPQSSDDMGLCYYHSERYLGMLKKHAAGRKSSHFLRNGINTACDLSAAFSQLFCSTAQGQIKPKTAAALASIGRLLLEAHQLAKQEFTTAFEEPWPEVVQQSFIFDKVPTDPSDTLVTVGPDPYANKYPYVDADKTPKPDLVRPGPLPPFKKPEPTTVSYPHECTPVTPPDSTKLM
jgi:hypothetical protein